MKVIVVDKEGGVVQWSAGFLSGFGKLGWETYLFPLNRGPLLWRLQDKFGLEIATKTLANSLKKKIELWRADLVIFFPSLTISEEFIHAAKTAKNSPLVVGMVGDRFGKDKASAASLFDRLFYSDTGFLDLAQQYGFPDNGVFLPHAANIDLFVPGPWPRMQRLVFVANVTTERQKILDSLVCPIDVYGRHWQHGGAQQQIHSKRIPLTQTAMLYAKHQAVLNVRHEHNIIQGINQRTFEALACGTPVLDEALADVSLCFEPGREILMWKSPEELNALCQQVLTDDAYARRIGEAGYRRVLAEHTYLHRARKILDELALK